MISYLICTYNREQYIGTCLSALAEQEADASEYEIVIVNNNSSDSTNALCTQFLEDHSHLQITYVIEHQQGLSHARNRAIRESKGDYLVFLDDDAFASPGYTKALVAFLQDHPETEAFGGRTFPKWESAEPRWMTPFLIPMLAVVDRGDDDGLFTGKSFPIGANMGFKRSVVEELGDFNTRLGRVGKNLASGEEKDLFDRVRKKGYDIHYIADARVDHIIPDSRLERAFIRRQAISIGHSERERTKMISTGAWWGRLLSEDIKWAATLVLAVYYTFTFRWAKAEMLIAFRWWVTSGLLNWKSPE